MGDITDRKDFFISLGYLGTWTLIALLTGAVGSAVVAGFHGAVLLVQKLFLSTGWSPLVFAVCGAALAGAITRIDAGSRGEGLPSYIHGVKTEGGVLPFRVTAVKAASAFSSLAAWGSGGYVGPLGRINSGIASFLVALIAPPAGDRSLRRTAAVCGLAATVASITGAPIGGGIFAVEIIQKRDMRYSDIFPAVLSGCAAVFLSETLFCGTLVNLNAAAVRIEPRHLPPVLITIFLTSAVTRIFEILYVGVSKLFRREKDWGVEVRFAAATTLAVGLLLLVNPAMLGTGSVFMREIFLDVSTVYGNLGQMVPLGGAVLVMVLIRMVSVILTVGSGQSAGFFAPLAQIGILLGTLTAVLFDMHGDSGDLHILQSAGFAGLIAGSLNVPIAAAVIVTEIYGVPFGLTAALAAVMGFQLNRHHTVYEFETDS